MVTSKKKVTGGGKKAAARSPKGSAVRKAGAKVVRAVKKAAASLKPAKSRNTGSKGSKKKATARPLAAKAPRKVQRKSDVAALDLVTPTPSQMSSRGPLDKPRGARFRDADAAGAVAITNERFSEEDQYTNRTGDKRIGTRGRKYE